MSAKEGFGLVEVLIACGIALVILLIGVSGTLVASGAARDAMVRQELLDDLQTTADLVADESSAAFYLYPTGSVLTLNAGVSAFTRNPRTGTNVWRVGTDPILAFVLPPADPSVGCAPEVEHPGASRASRAGCAEFVAFAAVRRAEVVQATLRGGEELSSSPGRDPPNDDAWLVYEYRQVLRPGVLDARGRLARVPVGPPDLANVGPDLLMDYVDADAFRVLLTRCEGRECEGPVASARSASLTLRARRRVGSRTLTTPEAVIPLVPRSLEAR